MALRKKHGKAHGKHGFTLIELLVVIAIIALLVSILMPSLAKARSLAKQATCSMHINNQLKGVVLYASEYDDQIPAGPDDLSNGVPMNQQGDNQIWTGGGESGQFNAHGAMVLSYIPQPQMVFCPGDDSKQIEDLPKALSEKPVDDIRCSYMYRQLDGQKAAVKSRRLSSLGVNNQDPALKVSALLLDMNSKIEMVIPGVMEIKPRVNHGALKVSVGFADTHVLVVDNKDDAFTIRMADAANMAARVTDIVEYADSKGQ